MIDGYIIIRGGGILMKKQYWKGCFISEGLKDPRILNL